MAIGDRYSFGPFSLDIARRRVLKNGRAVSWRSGRRFDLLKVLLDADGEVVPFDELIRAVWFGKQVDDHTIIKTANDLQRLLGQYADCIRNQPGVGYYFDPPQTATEYPSDLSPVELEALTLTSVGRQEWTRRTRSSLQRGLMCFRQAVKLNPSSTAAHLGVADCLVLLCHVGFAVLPVKKALPDARRSAETAFELAKDDVLRAAAKTTLAQIKLIFDWDFAAAEAGFTSAMALNDRHPAIYHGLAHLWLVTNRWTDALSAIAKARELAPGAPMIHGTAGWLLYFMRRTNDAIVACQQTTSLHPEFPAGYLMLGLAHEAAGEHERAITAFQTSFDLDPCPVPIAALGHAYATSGRRTKALSMLRLLDKMKEKEPVSPYFPAVVHAGLHDADSTLHYLGRACREKCDWMIHLAIDPRWDFIRHHSRFKRLLKLVGLVEFDKDQC